MVKRKSVSLLFCHTVCTRIHKTTPLHNQQFQENTCTEHASLCVSYKVIPEFSDDDLRNNSCIIFK